VKKPNPEVPPPPRMIPVGDTKAIALAQRHRRRRFEEECQVATMAEFERYRLRVHKNPAWYDLNSLTLLPYIGRCRRVLRSTLCADVHELNELEREIYDDPSRFALSRATVAPFLKELRGKFSEVQS
jgi:hypothetical protein